MKDKATLTVRIPLEVRDAVKQAAQRDSRTVSAQVTHELKKIYLGVDAHLNSTQKNETK